LASAGADRSSSAIASFFFFPLAAASSRLRRACGSV